MTKAQVVISEWLNAFAGFASSVLYLEVVLYLEISAIFSVPRFVLGNKERHTNFQPSQMRPGELSI